MMMWQAENKPLFGNRQNSSACRWPLAVDNAAAACPAL
jgi:hypothetical protein